MLKWIQGKKAASTLEFAALVVFVISALLVFQRYIYRGMAGSWKAAGDAFGHGRQYDPRNFGENGELGGTLELFFDYTHCKPGYRPPCHDPDHRINNWIDRRCIEVKHCDCTLSVDDPAYDSACLQCYDSCIYGRRNSP